LQNLKVDPGACFVEAGAADCDRLPCEPASEQACPIQPAKALLDLLKVLIEISESAAEESLAGRFDYQIRTW
jgi:hypothetical protein